LENTANKYDDNFRGLYCTCKRPYPDKESPVNNLLIKIEKEIFFYDRQLMMQ
jgi:E3 ubiquitin-protein ligase UBR7